ncbi:MAG: hypothetical protein NHB15_11470 [Methanosarcina barkeri]|nr:hypothetical protein [Methanosarcina sp. ERenArc_MAG2]
MAQSNEFILQDKINSDQVWKTVDLYSEEKSLGSEASLQRIMEGSVTIGNPVICSILRNQGETGATFWDYYIVSLPFTLHRLDGNRYYKFSIFQVTLDNPIITATDLFPQDITTETKIEKRFSISPKLQISFNKIAKGDMKIGGIESSKEYITLAPLITAFGRGQRQFYWEYKEFREQPVLPGDKQAVALLRIPHGTTKISAQISYKAVVIVTLFGMCVNKDVKSDTLPVTWVLM